MRREYVRHAAIEQLVAGLSDRDRAILTDLARVRVLSGSQLTRLHFTSLSPTSRERTRRRVLERLVTQQLAATLTRTIGGVRAGSSGLIYSLGIAGQQALPLLAFDTSQPSEAPLRSRTPWTPGTLFLRHSLAIAELYVQLSEAARTEELTLCRFVTEPASWYPNGAGGVIKPDAYTVLRHTDVEDCWWVEVDRATESLPTLRRKLMSYVDFAGGGQLGPGEVVPRVLLAVPNDHRLAAVHELIERLPEPAAQLITPVLHDQAVALVIDIVRGEP